MQPPSPPATEVAAAPSLTPLLIGLGAWLAAAVAIGAAGVLDVSPVPPPVLVFGLAAIGLALARMVPSVRTRVLAVPTRWMVGFHAIRVAAGAYFLLLHARGELPTEFAQPAGWGDILVGAAALVVAWTCLPARSAAQRTGLLAWNVLGLIDILMVLTIAARLFLRDPALVAPFAGLPLALLPLFVVPLVLITHVLLFSRARSGQPDES
jgi:hypothetical protein